MNELARFSQATGVRKFTTFSDGEPALKALKDMAARNVQGVDQVERSLLGTTLRMARSNE